MVSDLRGPAPGSQFSGHDPVYAWQDDANGGIQAGNDGTATTFARRTLAATGTTTIKQDFPIGADWYAVALRWAWCKEATGSGNVVFQIRYGLYYPLLGQSATNVSLTTISVPAIAVPGDPAGSSSYALPTETSAILTPVDGFLGTSPLLHTNIDRLGDNGSDTYASAVGLVVATITRVD